MRKRILAAILTTGALLSLAACSSGSGSSSTQGSQAPSSAPPSSAPAGTPSAQALVTDALNALKSAQSVRIAGGITQNGQKLHLDVGLLRSGPLSGTIGGPITGVQATVKIIITGGKAYILVSKPFFNAIAKARHIPSIACAALCGKYIAVPATQFSGLSLQGLSSQGFAGYNKAVPGVTVTSVNGVPAYRVSNGHGGYLYVAKNGTHYPLEITKSGKGAITFTEWNAVPPIVAPPSSQVIALPGGIG